MRLGLRRSLLLLTAILAVTCWAVTLEAAPCDRYTRNSSDWYRGEEGLRIVANILSWQTAQGDWPKSVDTTAQPFSGDVGKPRGTFDNGATTGELRVLAQAFNATKDPRCRQAFSKGLDLILEAQYPTGGWPQFYPPSSRYHRHITFNDGAMVRLMRFLRDVATAPEYAFVDANQRRAAEAAFDRGIQCILKCQIRVDGTLTTWCAQHDELDYSPRPGRPYELVSLGGAASADIVDLLMSIERPSPEVTRAIHAAAKWFETVRLEGIRVSTVDGVRVVVQDPKARPLWARFYDIQSNRPMFSGRDGVKRYALAEIEPERRNGYAWYGGWGSRVANHYVKWQERLSQNATCTSQ